MAKNIIIVILIIAEIGEIQKYITLRKKNNVKKIQHWINKKRCTIWVAISYFLSAAEIFVSNYLYIPEMLDAIFVSVCALNLMVSMIVRMKNNKKYCGRYLGDGE